MEEIRSVQGGVMPQVARTVGEAPISANNKSEKSSSVPTDRDEMDFPKAKEISKSLENALNASSKEVQFAVTAEEQSGNNINFKVVDKTTGEIVREFPSEELLTSIKKHGLQNMKHGLMLDAAA